MMLVIHIGYHKTGSTAVQTMLDRNRQRLEAAGIIYPPGLSSWPGHPELAWSFERSRLPWQDRDYEAEEVRQHYAAILEEHRGSDRILLLSSEEFCRLEFDLRSMMELRAFLAPWRPVILGYGRDPLRFLLSRYRHEVQSGAERRPLRQFICQLTNLQSAAFGQRMLKWDQLFEGRCIFRSYDAVLAEGRSITEDFLSLLGHGGRIEALDIAYDERKLNLALLEAHRILNAADLPPGQRYRLGTALLDLGDTLPEMTMAELARSLDLSPDLEGMVASLGMAGADMTRTLAGIRAMNGDQRVAAGSSTA